MGFIMDIIAVLIVALTIFFGYKKGLVGVAYKLLAFIVSIVLTFILYAPVSNFVIDNTQIDENIYSTVKQNLTGKEDMEYTRNGIYR